MHPFDDWGPTLRIDGGTWSYLRRLPRNLIWRTPSLSARELKQSRNNLTFSSGIRSTIVSSVTLGWSLEIKFLIYFLFMKHQILLFLSVITWQDTNYDWWYRTPSFIYLGRIWNINHPRRFKSLKYFSDCTSDFRPHVSFSH